MSKFSNNIGYVYLFGMFLIIKVVLSSPGIYLEFILIPNLI